MKTSRLALAFALIAGAVVLVTWYRGDERRINARLTELQELVSKRPGEGSITSLTRAGEIADLFASTFEVRADAVSASTSDRRTLMGYITQFRAGSSAIVMRVYDRELTIDGRRATLLATGEFVTGLGGIGDLGARESYRFQMNWVEEGGDWKFALVIVLEVLEAPRGRLGF